MLPLKEDAWKYEESLKRRPGLVVTQEISEISLKVAFLSWFF